jgi:hypothetical protein
MDTIKQEIKELSTKRSKPDIIRAAALIRQIDREFQLDTCLCTRENIDRAKHKITEWVKHNIDE